MNSYPAHLVLTDHRSGLFFFLDFVIVALLTMSRTGAIMHAVETAKEQKMTTTTHTLRVHDVRRIKHPVFPKVQKHIFLIRAIDLPDDLHAHASVLEASLNHAVCKDVRESLLGRDGPTGSFDLMNQGITIIAEDVKRIDDKTYELFINDDQGIVDGINTYRIISECRDDPNLSEDQFVEVHVRIGIQKEDIKDISRGLNSAMQVRQHILTEITKTTGKLDWIEEALEGVPKKRKISWCESDDGELDVRDLICILEAFNIFEYPNDERQHPICAYMNQHDVVEKFAREFDTHKDQPAKSNYYKLLPILRDCLYLYELIRYELVEVWANEYGTHACIGVIAEQPRTTEFVPLFNSDRRLAKSYSYRISKGVVFPILAAFRSMVQEDPKTGHACWNGGFDEVLALWDLAQVYILWVVRELLGDEPVAHNFGRDARHWSMLHQILELQSLRKELAKVRLKAA